MAGIGVPIGLGRGAAARHVGRVAAVRLGADGSAAPCRRGRSCCSRSWFSARVTGPRGARRASTLSLRCAPSDRRTIEHLENKERGRGESAERRSLLPARLRAAAAVRRRRRRDARARPQRQRDDLLDLRSSARARAAGGGAGRARQSRGAGPASRARRRAATSAPARKCSAIRCSAISSGCRTRRSSGSPRIATRTPTSRIDGQTVAGAACSSPAATSRCSVFSLRSADCSIRTTIASTARRAQSC